MFEAIFHTLRRLGNQLMFASAGFFAAQFCSAHADTPARTTEGFAVPQPGHHFEFPQDHGSHPEFKIEWWYITGHLFTADHKRYGYQATFFRDAAPDHSTEIFLAHMALVDVSNGRFYFQERVNREGWDASAAVGHLSLTNGPWSLEMTKTDPVELHVAGGVHADVLFDLQLSPTKSLVIFGDNGVSRKGADPTAASYYLTYPRLRTTGTLQVGETHMNVSGESWMDHEISSSQLSAGQVGWDWLSVQFNDGRELMLYRLRLRDGSSDPMSTLTWVSREGRLQRAPFDWKVLSTWRSPATKAAYPSRVSVTTRDPVSQKEVQLQIEPLVTDQELNGQLGGIPYWEGACRVLDTSGKEIGSAYMELTGYAKELRLDESK
jgi:predicted secreted hydrolase